MTVLAVPAAVLVGLLLGALGGGGAVLTLPALVHLLGQTPQEATTGSLVVVGVTSLVALLPHARRHDVRVGQGLTFGALGTAGALAGSALSTRLPASTLLVLFATLMLVIAVLMARRAISPAPTAEPDLATEPMLTLRPLTCRCPRVAKVLVTATGVGLLTGLLGVGGGFVLVPALVLALALPMSAAVGTSLLVIAVNSATALVARVAWSPAEVDWSALGLFTLVAVLGSLAGARLGPAIPARVRTGAFSALLVVVAGFTVVTAAS